MFKRYLAATSCMLVTFLLVTLSLCPLTNAATTTSGSGSGLTISPLSTNISMNPGQTQTVPVYIQNVTSSTSTIEVDINDFLSGSLNGKPALLLNGQYAPSHSLKHFIAPINNLTLGPGQQAQVNVNITIPKGTTGGGYYAAVRFTPIVVSGGKTITLAASVASLILVRVSGNVIDDLKLASFDIFQNNNGSPQVIFFSNKNLIVGATFNNVGNVQEQPFGKIILKNGDKEISSYNINTSSPAGNILPSSERIFTINLTNVGIIGRYTLEGNFGYGNNGQFIGGSTTFYVIPLNLVIIVLVVIVLILFLIFGLPRIIRSYNRRVIRKARHI
jgi:hypothetical protein